jgi:ribosomal protein L20
MEMLIKKVKQERKGEYGEDASAMKLLTKKVKQARAYNMEHRHTRKM